MLSLIKTIFAIFLLSVTLLGHADEKIKIQNKNDSGVHLTPKERAWLKKHQPIRIAFDGSLPPYSFINDSGQFEGIAIEIINILSQRLGIKFKTYPNVSWNRIYKAAGARQVDVVATMVDRPERRLWFNFTQPYLTKSLVIITKQDNTEIRSRQDLKKKKVALVKGYQYGDIVIKDFPTVKPYYVSTMLNGLKAVANGKADAAITFMATANYLQTKHLMENLKFADFYDRNSANESIAVRKDWPLLVSIFQKGLDSLSEKEMQSIFAKWVFRVDPPEEKSNNAELALPPVSRSDSLDYLFLGKILVPFLIIMSFLLAWLFHAHSQNRKIIQSKNQVLITNRNLQALQSDLEHLVLKRTAELNSSEQKFRSLVENLRNEYFFYHHDNAGIFTYVSPSVTNILGYSSEEFMAHYREYLTDNAINQKIDEYTELCTQGVPNPPYQVEIYDRRKIVHWLEIADSPVYDEYGNCIGVDGIVHDITVRKLADERLIRLSYYDDLTGLANRRLFSDRLQQTLNLANRNKSSVALFYLDLDEFKAINDNMGHAAGDEILKEASRRLTSTLRDSDVAARLGGDEFALLLPGTDAVAAVQVAEKILKMFRKPYLLGETTAALGASIGIAVYPQNGRECETLVNNADTAMYHSKKKNLGYSFYADHMEQAMDRYA